LSKSCFTTYIFSLCATCFIWCGTAEASEKAVFELWEKHVSTPEDHRGFIESCREVVKANPNHPLLPVVRQLEIWHLFKTGQLTEAEKLLNTQLSLPDSPLNQDARRLAMGWLARLDREKVVNALKAYYKSEVEFPNNLSKLSGTVGLPLRDRFGKPWVYSLTGFSKLGGFANQKYSLESEDLGDASDYQSVINLSYASGLEAEPVQMASDGGTPAVTFNLSGREVKMGVGQGVNGIFVSFIGEQIIVVCDNTFWKIFERP